MRISGDGAAAAMEAMGLEWDLPNCLRLGRLKLSDNLRLPVMFAVFRSPRSYTGQDMAEIQLPGNPALLEQVIHLAIDRGARIAEPGEFTCRAFLAGKMDLPQAEGVAATVAAASDSQLHAARLLRNGRLGAFAAELVDVLGSLLALVEAGIDFTDQEDVVPISPFDLANRLGIAAGRLDDLLSHSRSWGAIEALPRVVLAGATSTGKSTLFNALLRQTRAVISPMPGTTRDIIEEALTLRNAHGRDVEIMLVDIAGLNTPENALDHQVQLQAQTALERADLVIHVDDTRRFTNRPMAHSADLPVLRAHTKSDLSPSPPADELSVCALTGDGLEELRSAIAAAIGDRAVGVSAQMLALQPRHASALHAAAQHLSQAQRLLEPQRDAHAIDSVELIAQAIRGALDELAGLGGQMSPNDVIDRVFARFCIGK